MTVWTRWLPWRFVIRRLARAHGFLDPLALIAQLRRFAQPSEVGEPVELLRAGMVFHARGLINSRVLQHNLDWVWPYWVERQFDPKDDAFVPRAFSITQVNLTHRNWTAIGVPDCEALPIVDPRGLLTPHFRMGCHAAQLFPARGGRGADPVFGDPDALAGYGRVACIRPRADGLRRGIAAADARAAAPGAREVVSDGINGRLLEVEESAAFADALDWAAGRSPQQMDALRQAARTTAEAFSMQSTAEKALAAYVAVTSRHAVPGACTNVQRADAGPRY